MRAVVLTRFGPPEVLQPAKRPDPVPKGHQLLVRVRATSVNYGDLVVRDFPSVTREQFNMPALFHLLAKLAIGTRRPKSEILGSEFSGVVEAVGAAVTRFAPGDEVFGYLGQGMGAYAERLVVGEDGCVAPRPENLSHAEAAVAAYGAVMAVSLMRRAPLAPGKRALIVGASGSIGRAALQLARHAGATVDAVCGAAGAETVRALGAERVFDYRREDFRAGGGRWELIVDVLGRCDLASCRAALAPEGRLLHASFKGRQLRQALGSALRRNGPRAICAIAPGGQGDLFEVRRLLEEGVLRVPPPAVFPLEQAAAAHRHAESEQRGGPVALVVGEDAVAG
jgi:NADPH:quinone reductase-like Zn-dependent oxidoreductase